MTEVFAADENREELKARYEIRKEVEAFYVDQLGQENISEMFLAFDLQGVDKEKIARFQKERDRVAAYFIQEVRRHPTLCKVATRHLVNIALRAAVRILVDGKKEVE